jgi:hypothetical protein
MMFVIALLLVISVIGLFFVRQLHARQRLAAELQPRRLFSGCWRRSPAIW